jgi:hypothetical protein
LSRPLDEAGTYHIGQFPAAFRESLTETITAPRTPQRRPGYSINGIKLGRPPKPKPNDKQL